MQFSYKGFAHIAYKHGQVTSRKLDIHNAGLSDIALMFAKAAAGAFKAEDDAPRLLDVGYIVPSSDTYTATDQLSVWQSILNNPIPIGGRQFRYDEEEDNWVASLTTTILWSDLNGSILDEALQNAEDEKVQLQIRLCSYPVKNRKYFAKLDVTPADIRAIRETTSAIVTWIMELVYEDQAATVKSGSILRKG